ncbi:MAG: phytoene dehydrogenase [Bacteroidetes bacterium]|nr:phytoene dehydrogenase [Bacteroidota bacterium]
MIRSGQKKAIVIGAGFAGLSAASKLAKEGFDVTLLEKNAEIGGRARKLEIDGFTFDMGPSWYWMPDVFEDYFKEFNTTVAEQYELIRLDPSYAVFFGKDDVIRVPANLSEFYALFEKHEPGSSVQLKKFLADAGYKYKVSMSDFVHKPSLSILEFMDFRILNAALRMDLFKSISKYIRKHFKNEKLVQLLEFPVLFLGAKPNETPALYSMMNYADIVLGTWYPMGGMAKIVDAMVNVAKQQGVKILTNEIVERINVKGNKAVSVVSSGKTYTADVIIGAADYHHIEQNLLEEPYRNYSTAYWKSRKMAPSCLMYYVGINKKIEGLEHHNLFFDAPFDLHAEEIYDRPQWPENPLFYSTCASKTDKSVAPEGMENLVLLIPVAVNIEDTEEIREKYFNIMMGRLEHLTGQQIRQHVIVKKSYAINDFKKDYNSFGGNAYGLANTLRQTAILKPSLKNKKVNNLYYAGQLTVPGPGVPPSIISGLVAAKEVIKKFRSS